MRLLFIFVITALLYWPSFIIFALVLFRQKIQKYKTKIIISSFLMAVVTLLVQSNPYPVLITIIQPLCLILCMLLVFKFRILIAILMTVLTYNLSYLLEVVLNAILTRFSTADIIAALQDNVIFPAFVLSFFNIIFCLLLYKSRLGFSLSNVHFSRRKSGRLFQKKMYLPLMISLFALSTGCLTIYHITHLVFLDVFVLLVLFIYLIKELYHNELHED